jgi:hypothetical protein
MNINLLIIIFVFILFFISKYSHEPFTDDGSDVFRENVSLLDLKVDKIGINKSDDFPGIQNIYGDTIKVCANHDKDGSFDSNGYCPHGQKDKKNTYYPRLCMTFRPGTQNFAKQTGHGKFNNWSEELITEKNNCVTLGSFSYFKSEQKKGNIIPKTFNELRCSAIPESIFSPLYYDEWNKGKKKKFTNDKQIIDGLETVFVQCLNKTSIPEYKTNLKQNFCKFINSNRAGNLKNNKRIKKLNDAHCTV